MEVKLKNGREIKLEATLYTPVININWDVLDTASLSQTSSQSPSLPNILANKSRHTCTLDRLYAIFNDNNTIIYDNRLIWLRFEFLFIFRSRACVGST